jgi:hypothetical protein
MKFTYVYHSCYVLETDTCSVIFDFYKDSGELWNKGFIHDELLSDSSKPLYVLSSHVHPDHFNASVLLWRAAGRNITYILSKDILDNKRAETSDDTVFLDKGDEYKDQNLYVKAFGSTDVGVSFFLKLDGKSIFHAGDLNNWHWKDESTAEEVAEAEAFYHRELSDITREFKHLDLAIFPVDPRLGTDYSRGAREFLSQIEVDTFAPMHFGEAYSTIAQFKEVTNAANCKYLIPINKGQSFFI